MWSSVTIVTIATIGVQLLQLVQLVQLVQGQTSLLQQNPAQYNVVLYNGGETGVMSQWRVLCSVLCCVMFSIVWRMFCVVWAVCYVQHCYVSWCDGPNISIVLKHSYRATIVGSTVMHRTPQRRKLFQSCTILTETHCDEGIHVFQ